MPALPGKPEKEYIGVVGYHEDTGGYVAGISALGYKVGGESNYVEALGGVETVLDLSSGDTHVEPIGLVGGGLGPEQPGICGLGVTAGIYMTPEDSGAYVGLQGGFLGEHVSVGVGWATEPSPPQSIGPDKGAQGNRSY